MKTDNPRYTKFKELWEMTREEFISHTEMRSGTTRKSSRIGLNNHVITNEERWHRLYVDIIKYALKKNKPVPPEVLKDYPELRRN